MISNVTTIAAVMQIQTVCSILSRSMPDANVTTDAVSMLHRLFGCCCWQCIHDVKVKIVVKRKSVCRMPTDRCCSRRRRVYL